MNRWMGIILVTTLMVSCKTATMPIAPSLFVSVLSPKTKVRALSPEIIRLFLQGKSVLRPLRNSLILSDRILLTIVQRIRGLQEYIREIEASSLSKKLQTVNGLIVEYFSRRNEIAVEAPDFMGFIERSKLLGELLKQLQEAALSKEDIPEQVVRSIQLSIAAQIFQINSSAGELAAPYKKQRQLLETDDEGELQEATLWSV